VPGVWILVGLVVQPDIQRTLPIELGESAYIVAFT